MVIPRSRSSGALSMVSNARNATFGLCLLSTLVIAAVKVVLPWSMCPIVPMFTCGLLRSNFSFAISSSAPQSKSCKKPVLPKLLSAAGLLHNLFGESSGKFRVMRKMHGEIAAALRAASQIGGVAEHFRQRHLHANHVAARAALRALNLRAPGVQVAKHRGHVFFRNHH